MFNDNHIIDLLPEYTLGILNEEDTRKVETHLAVCSACKEELRHYNHVLADLPLAAVQTAPPASLKTRILEQAERTRAPAPAMRQTASWWQVFLSGMRGTAPVWGLVSLVLVLALLAGNIWQQQQINKLKSANTQFQVIALAGTQAAPGATGVMIVSPDGADGTLVVDNLPALDKDHQYQLWLIQKGQRTSGGLFVVGNDGYGYMEVFSPQPLNKYDSFGITIEPAGGSPQPTGNKVLGSS